MLWIEELEKDSIEEMFQTVVILPKESLRLSLDDAEESCRWDLGNDL